MKRTFKTYLALNRLGRLLLATSAFLLISSQANAQPIGTEKWSFQTGGNIFSSPVVASDGTIYVGSDDTYLYAINPDGTQAWRFQTGNAVISTPVVGPDGVIYVGSDDNYLYAINPNGTQKWRFQAGDRIDSSPAIASDGTVYAGSHDGYLYAVNPNGTQKWAYQTGNSVYSSPTIGSDGTVYVGSRDTYLYAINADGSLKWRYQTGSVVYSSPAVDANGVVYVGSDDTYVYAINPNGTLKWQFQTGNWVTGSPKIASDGTIYVGADDRYMYALNPDGTQRWRYQTGGLIFRTTAIGADGTLYFGSGDSYLYALDSDGTLKWQFQTSNAVYSSPAIGSDGTVYVGSDDDYLYAVYAQSSSNFNLNSDTAPDLMQLGKDTNDRSKVMVHDGSSNDLTGHITYPGWFDVKQVEAMLDANSNGYKEFLSLGNTSDGKSALMLHDGNTRVLINALVLPSWFNIEQMQVLQDMTGNGASEAVVLGKTTDGKTAWIAYDIATRTEISRHVFPSWVTIQEILTLSDISGNDADELISIGFIGSENRNVWFVQDVKTSTQLIAQKETVGEQVIDAAVIGDSDKDGAGELALLTLYNSGANHKVLIRETDDASEQATYNYPGWYDPTQLTAVLNNKTRGFRDSGSHENWHLISVGQTSDNKAAYFVNDVATGTLQRSLPFPGWLKPTSISALPDMGGDVRSEVSILAATTDGKCARYVIDPIVDGLSGPLLFPGWFECGAFPVKHIKLAQTNKIFFEYEVTGSPSELTFALSGGTGDADLYVRHLYEPTLTPTQQFDCGSDNAGNNESCTVQNPENGKWSIMVYGNAASSDVKLTVTPTY